MGGHKSRRGRRPRRPTFAIYNYFFLAFSFGEGGPLAVEGDGNEISFFIMRFIIPPLAFSFGEGGPLAVEEVGNETSISLKT